LISNKIKNWLIASGFSQMFLYVVGLTLKNKGFELNTTEMSVDFRRESYF